MSRRRWCQALAGICCLAAGLPGAVWAVETESIWLEAAATTGAAYLGQPFQVVLTAGVRNASVRLPGASVPWPGCQILKYSEQDVSRRHEGFVARQGQYTVAAFTCDQITIPALPIYFSAPDGTTATAASAPMMVKILSVYPRPGLELQAPRPPRDEPPPWPYWLAGAVVAAGAGLGWWRLRLPQRKTRNKNLRPPHQEALLALDALDKSRLVAEGEAALYFTELSRILRHYLARRFELSAMELPRHDILHALKDKGINSRLRRLADSLLIRADLVKFAHVDTDFIQIIKAQQRVRELIEKTRMPLEISAPAGGRRHV